MQKIENARKFLFQCRKYFKRTVTINKSKLGILNHKKGTCLLTWLPLQYFGSVTYDPIERHTSIANLTLLCLLCNAFKHHPFWSTLFVPCNLHIEYSWPMYIFFLYIERLPFYVYISVLSFTTELKNRWVCGGMMISNKNVWRNLSLGPGLSA